MNSIFQSEYNEEGKRNLYFENISKMIINRNITSDIDENKWVEIFNQLKQNYENDTSFYRNGEQKIAIKLLSRKITTIRKVEDIDDFLDKYQDYYKFIIFNRIAPKAYKQFLEYSNLEVFSDEELLTNIIEHIFVPKHILLSAEDQAQIRKEYGFKRNEIGKIKHSDPIARYYNLKVNEIIAIERPSRTSGISMYYRICIPSSYFS